MLKEVMTDMKAEFEYDAENRRYVKFTDIVVAATPPPSFESGGFGGFVTVPAAVTPKARLHEFTNEAIVAHGTIAGFGGLMMDRRVTSLAQFILSLKKVITFRGPAIVANWTCGGTGAPYSLPCSSSQVDMVLVKYLYMKQRIMEEAIEKLIHAVTAIQSIDL